MVDKKNLFSSASSSSSAFISESPFFVQLQRKFLIDEIETGSAFFLSPFFLSLWQPFFAASLSGSEKPFPLPPSSRRKNHFPISIPSSYSCRCIYPCLAPQLDDWNCYVWSVTKNWNGLSSRSKLGHARG